MVKVIRVSQEVKLIYEVEGRKSLILHDLDGELIKIN